MDLTPIICHYIELMQMCLLHILYILKVTLIIIILLVCVRVSTCGGHRPTCWNWLSFFTMWFWDQNHAVRIVSKFLYPFSHLGGP